MATPVHSNRKPGAQPHTRSPLTIPNLLSGLRLASIPLLLVLAWRGHAQLYLLCLGGALATDLFDGFLARALHQETDLGAQLDLWGDAGVLLSLPVAMGFLWPEVLRREAWVIAAVVALYAMSAVLAWRKFGQLASYHTWYGKTAQASISIAAFLTLLGWVPWALRAGILIMMVAVLEEIAITLTLPRPQHNIPSWWHARQRAQSPATLTRHTGK